MSTTISLFNSTAAPQTVIPEGTQQVAIYILPGADEIAFSQVLGSVLHAPQAALLVQTENPGPLVLSQGLRILPHEVLPRFRTPDRLIILIPSDARFPMQAEAYLRRLFRQQVPVVVVSDTWPACLQQLQLEPGQVLPRIDLADLPRYLEEWLE